jgi:hypothetical protein
MQFAPHKSEHLPNVRLARTSAPLRGHCLQAKTTAPKSPRSQPLHPRTRTVSIPQANGAHRLRLDGAPRSAGNSTHLHLRLPPFHVPVRAVPSTHRQHQAGDSGSTAATWCAASCTTNDPEDPFPDPRLPTDMLIAACTRGPDMPRTASM